MQDKKKNIVNAVRVFHFVQRGQKLRQMTCCSAAALPQRQQRQNRHFYIFINLTAVISGTITDCHIYIYIYIFCNTVTMCVYGYFRDTDSCSHSNAQNHVLRSHFSTMDSSLSLSLCFIPSLFLSLSHPHTTVQPCEPSDRSRVENVFMKSAEAFPSCKERYLMATVVFPVPHSSLDSSRVAWRLDRQACKLEGCQFESGRRGNE